MKDFKNKVVVITGGSMGIGKAMADKFGSLGAKVIISARREQRLIEAVKDLKKQGIQASYKTCDVSKLEEIKALERFVIERYGHIDVVVNNAGITGQAGPVVDMPIEAFQQVINVNVFGVVNSANVFGKRFIKQKTPAMFINMASEVGLYPVGPMMSTYTSSKYMQRAITSMLKLEMPSFVEVCGIYPGLVQSELGGSKDATAAGMPTATYVDFIWPQIENGELYIVSHPWGREYFKETAQKIIHAFDQYAPHYDGDDVYDTRSIAKKMFENQ